MWALFAQGPHHTPGSRPGRGGFRPAVDIAYRGKELAADRQPSRSSRRYGAGRLVAAGATAGSPRRESDGTAVGLAAYLLAQRDLGGPGQPAGKVTRWEVELSFSRSGWTGTFRFPALGCSGNFIMIRISGRAASARHDMTVNPRPAS